MTMNMKPWLRITMKGVRKQSFSSPRSLSSRGALKQTLVYNTLVYDSETNVENGSKLETLLFAASEYFIVFWLTQM